MKRLFLIILLIITIVSFKPVFAADMDEFSQLEALKIGSVLETTIINLGQKEASTDPQKLIYTYPSEKYSNPHIVYTTPDNKITFIQLTIPESQTGKYLAVFKTYPKADQVSLKKTKSEEMVGIPKLGIAFIFDGYTNTVLRVQKFAPKAKDGFINQEGKNFKPEQQVFLAEPKETNKFPFIIVIIVITFIIVIILLKFKPKKPPTSTSMQETPITPESASGRTPSTTAI